MEEDKGVQAAREQPDTRGRQFRQGLGLKEPSVRAEARRGPYPFAVENTSHRKTVLIVDDEAQIRRALQEGLRREGYNVLLADGASEALRINERYPGPIRLLLTDMSMPGMTGLELAERLRSVRPEISVLFISGSYPKTVDFARVRSDPGTRFLQKPFSMNSLLRMVDHMMDMSRPEEEGEDRHG
jgi:two-component system cell cycle sensor histidine kinase/response regulator CckA